MALPKVDTSSYCTASDYWNLPDGVRAELIDGTLYDMTPPSSAHQIIAFGIAHTLQRYVDETGGPCKVIPAPFAVNLHADDTTYVEPDVSVICDPAKISTRGCEGAPDLVIEVVSPSNWRMDYFKKCTLYEQAGVREYWIVDPRCEQTVVCRYESEDRPMAIYPFSEPIPVGIWDDAAHVTVASLL